MLPIYALTGITVLLATLTMPTPKTPEKVKFINLLAIVQALVFLGLSVYALLFTPLPVFYFPDDYLFIDPLGAYAAFVSSVIFLLSAVYARGYLTGLMRLGELRAEELKIFYGAMSLIMTVIVFALFANNLALYWILLELTTLLSAALVVTLRVKENIVAALKYIFTASSVMLFSFIGLIVLFEMTRQATGEGTLNWSVLMAEAGRLPGTLFTFAFVLIFVGFAAKVGIVPFHTWLPQTYSKAPTVISVLLSAAVLNAGLSGILRIYAVAHRTEAVPVISAILVVFGLASIGIAALSMLPRTNIKKLIAFSSIEHTGLILVGIGLGTATVIFWCLFYLLAQALVKALLFFSAGILHHWYGTNRLTTMDNILTLQPFAAWGLAVGSVAIIGTPLFPVFLPKLFILRELAAFSLPALFAALVLFLIVAAAFAAMLVKNFPRRNETANYEQCVVPWAMKAPMIFLFISILALGLYVPEGLRQVLNSIVVSLGF